MCYGNDSGRQGGLKQTPRVLMVGKLLSDYQNRTWPIRGLYRDHLTNQRTAGNSIKVTDTWILREEVTWEKGGKWSPDNTFPLSPSDTLQGKFGAGETRNHKRIMEILIEHLNRFMVSESSVSNMDR